MFTIVYILLVLAILLPIPAYLFYCHKNKKDPDRVIMQYAAFSSIVPALVYMSFDEFMDPMAAYVLFGVLVGAILARIFSADGAKK